jgi:general secretion pathway protein H
LAESVCRLVAGSCITGLRTSRGFSLVEILVVVLIIGLATSFVSFNVGGNSRYQLLAEARQFANSAALIAEEAVLSNQQWGIDIFRQNKDGVEQFGYRWLVRNDEGVWQLANRDGMAEELLFSPEIGLRLQLDGVEQEQEIGLRQKIAVQDELLVDPEPRAENHINTDQAGLMDEQDPLDAQEPVEPALIEPAIWLLSSGETSVFTLTLFDQSADPHDFDPLEAENAVQIKGDELGRITVETGAQANEEE